MDYYRIEFFFDAKSTIKNLQKDLIKLSANFSKNFSVNFSKNFSVKGKQLDRMVSIIVNIAEGNVLNLAVVSKEFNVSLRTVYEDIRKLRTWGIVKFEGSPKTGKYVLTDKGENIVEEVIEK